MHLISETVNYVLFFIALYAEVFFLVTFFEHKDKKEKNKSTICLLDKSVAKRPSVSIIVPVWNEETTVLKTVFSILKLDYPKDKLKILIVDDGSTDNTWRVIQRFAKNKRVRLLHKQNGGKYTALNHALQFIETDLVGCLDADSFVHPQALKRIVSKFSEPEIMAVTPSIKAFEPEGFLGLIQKAEYIFGVFLRKVFHSLDAIYIAPGPFSIFRRKVFEQIGGYKHAHNTEDMEIAMRMHKNRMKISNVHNAFVYTTIPLNFKGLYRQRLRWTYGFLRNTLDYRDMFFKPQYGNLGFMVLPVASFSVVSTVYLFGSMLFEWAKSLLIKVQEIFTVGIYFKSFNFDFFYLNTNIMAFVSLVAVMGTLVIILVSRQLAEEETKFGLDSVFFLIFYAFLAPIWLSKAFYNLIFAKTSDWR